MITPQDIKKQSLSWWKELLLSITTGESFFPKEISRIGKITAKDILLKLTEYKASIAELQKGASLWGYTVEMTEKSFDWNSKHSDLHTNSIFRDLLAYYSQTKRIGYIHPKLATNHQ